MCPSQCWVIYYGERVSAPEGSQVGQRDEQVQMIHPPRIKKSRETTETSNPTKVEKGDLDPEEFKEEASLT